MIEKHTLKNGLRVVAQNRPNSLVTSILIAVKTGSRNETPDINGMSHFLEHMTFKGTKKRPTAQIISKEIDEIGAYNNAYTNSEYTFYFITCNYGEFEKSLDILTDIVFSSTINLKELEKEKGTIIEEINKRKDNPEISKWVLFNRTIYKNFLLSQDVIGSKKSVKFITADVMKDYYNRYYKAGNVILSLVGNLPTSYLKNIEGVLSGIRGTEKDYVKNEKENHLFKKSILLENRDTAQSHIVMGVNSYPKKSLKIYSLELLSTILGGNTSSRLWREIREKRGLAYTVGSYNDNGFDNGIFGIYGGINNKNIIEALKIMRNEVFSISKNVTEDELILAKKYTRGMFSLKEESSVNVAESNVVNEMIGRGAITTKEKIKLYEKVSLNDIRNVADELFKPEKLKLAVIGPFKDEEKFVKILES